MVPIVTKVFVYEAEKRRCVLFHPEIEGAGVDLVVACQGYTRVGESIARLSLLLTGVDCHLAVLAGQANALVEDARRGAPTGTGGDGSLGRLQVIGRGTYGLHVAVNGFFYFARSLMDQAVDLISCTVGVRVSETSFRWAAKDGAKKFRDRLRSVGAEPVAGLVDRAWSEWGARLRGYRDLLAHDDALAMPPVELVEDEKTGAVVGLRLHLPEDGKIGSYVNASDYFIATRLSLVRFLTELLGALRAARLSGSEAH
jgi:hypothetical protein